MTGQGVLIFTYGIMASLDSLNTPKYNVVFDFIAPKQLINIIPFYLSEQHIIILYLLFQSYYYAISTFVPLFRREKMICYVPKLNKYFQETHKCIITQG